MVRREDVAHAVEHAALAVPGVARLSPGGPVEVSTQYAGGKVLGVRITDSTAEVHIVADRTPLPAVAQQVRTAVRTVLAAAGHADRITDERVTVVIDDIVDAAADRRNQGPA